MAVTETLITSLIGVEIAVNYLPKDPILDEAWKNGTIGFTDISAFRNKKLIGIGTSSEEEARRGVASLVKQYVEAFHKGDTPALQAKKLAESRAAAAAGRAESKPDASKKASVKSDGGYQVRTQQEQSYLVYQIPNYYSEAKRYMNWLNFNVPQEITDGNMYLFKSFSKTNGMPILNEIPPSILSSLTPKLKLYKVFYKSDGIESDEEGEPANPAFINDSTFDWEIPFDAYTNQSDVRQILENGYGVLNGVNIVDFSYQYVGTNRESAEVSLVGKLVLKFQSLDKLLEEKIISLDGSKYSFKYSDLVNQESRFAKDGISYNDRYYRIKAVLGFGYSKDVITRIKDEYFNAPDKVDALVSALEKATAVIHMYHVGHEINFSKEGTVDLTIDFQGAIESILFNEASDVLLASPEGKWVMTQMRLQLASIKDRKMEEAEERKNAAAEGRKPREKTDEEKEAEKKADTEVAIMRSKLYSAFLQTLFSEDNGVNLKHLRYISEEENKLQKELGIDVNSVFDDEIETNSKLLAAYRTGENLKASQGKISLTIVDNDYRKKLIDKVKSAIEKDPNDITAISLQSDEENSIQFFFLGDLIDYVLGWVKQNFRELGDPDVADDMYPKFIYGNIDLILSKYVGEVVSQNAELRERVTDTSYDSIAQFSRLTINLAELPISVNYFTKWFTDKVIKPKRNSYPLQVFLHDIIDLIQMSTTKIYGEKLATAINSRTISLPLTVNQTLFDRLGGGGAVRFQELAGLGAFTIDQTNKSRSIVVTYVSSIPVLNIQVSEVQKNADNGIFTFTIGKSSGIVKEIKFNKQNVRYLKEARMSQEGSLANGFLRMKYDADIILYGPSLFIPGDLVVINPAFITNNSLKFRLPEDQRDDNPLINAQKVLINELGLGGIYVITKIDCDVASGKHETKLKCTFHSYGSGVLTVGSRTVGAY